MGRPTRYAVVEPGRLLADLEQTVQRGYAVTREEMTLGTCSVAAPVLDCAGRPAAAVAVVVDTVRVEPAKLTPPVRLAAEGIAARLHAGDLADGVTPVRGDRWTHRG